MIEKTLNGKTLLLVEVPEDAHNFWKVDAEGELGLGYVTDGGISGFSTGFDFEIIGVASDLNRGAMGGNKTRS